MFENYQPEHTPYWVFTSTTGEEYLRSDYFDVDQARLLKTFTKGYADLEVTRSDVKDTIRWIGKGYENPFLPNDR